MAIVNARPEWVTTTILLEQLADFDDAVWTRFAQRFRGPLVEFARRYGLSDDAGQDVAQEALLAFAVGYRGGRFERGRGKLRSWLFGIAHREVLRRLRSDATRRARGGDVLPERPTDDASAESAWQQAWDRHVLAECLEIVRRQVEPTTFAAFERVTLHGVPPQIAANDLGITRNAVFIAKHRVLSRLEAACRAYEAEG